MGGSGDDLPGLLVRFASESQQLLELHTKWRGAFAGKKSAKSGGSAELAKQVRAQFGVVSGTVGAVERLLADDSAAEVARCLADLDTVLTQNLEEKNNAKHAVVEAHTRAFSTAVVTLVAAIKYAANLQSAQNSAVSCIW